MKNSLFKSFAIFNAYVKYALFIFTILNYITWIFWENSFVQHKHFIFLYNILVQTRVLKRLDWR